MSNFSNGSSITGQHEALETVPLARATGLGAITHPPSQLENLAPLNGQLFAASSPPGATTQPAAVTIYLPTYLSLYRAQIYRAVSREKDNH